MRAATGFRDSHLEKKARTGKCKLMNSEQVSQSIQRIAEAARRLDAALAHMEALMNSGGPSANMQQLLGNINIALDRVNQWQRSNEELTYKQETYKQELRDMVDRLLTMPGVDRERMLRIKEQLD